MRRLENNLEEIRVELQDLRAINKNAQVRLDELHKMVSVDLNQSKATTGESTRKTATAKLFGETPSKKTATAKLFGEPSINARFGETNTSGVLDVKETEVCLCEIKFIVPIFRCVVAADYMDGIVANYPSLVLEKNSKKIDTFTMHAWKSYNDYTGQHLSEICMAAIEIYHAAIKHGFNTKISITTSEYLYFNVAIF